MIVDTHMHCGLIEHYLDGFREKRIAQFKESGSRMEDIEYHMNNLPETYLSMAEGLIDKAFACACRFEKTAGRVVPNSYIAEVVNKYPDKFRGICAVDPTEGETAVKEFETCIKNHGFVALKLAPPYQLFSANDRMCYPLYEKAVELGIPIQFHIGLALTPNARLKYAKVLDLDDVAIDFPQLKIVILHFGYYNFADTVSLMMKHPNVYTDVSWLGWMAGLDRHLASANMPVVDNPYFNWLYPLSYAMSAVCGLPNKIMFCTDWPAMTPPRGIEILRDTNSMLKEHNLPPIPTVTIDNIIGENWRQVYRI